jgi:glutathione S-transferase
MILYTCGQRKKGASLPGPLAHPCGHAAKALDDAGHAYELRVVPGYRLAPWTWRTRSSDRAEITRLSGQEQVPILVLDTGAVVAGSAQIAQWARENAPAEDRATAPGS